MNLVQSQRSRVVASVLVFVAGLAVGPVACHKDTKSAEPTPSTAPSAETKKAPLADRDIAQAIRRYMKKDSVLRSEHVEVVVTQGIAKLTGLVASLLAKEHAVRVAETIKGVRAVVDQVTVATVARTDTQLKSDVTSALQRDIATRPFAIGVAVKDGNVTLSGTTDSWQQRSLFADVAKTVNGVKALENSIGVHYAATRSESEIATDVKRRIANDVWLDGNVLGVTATGHTVHLMGVVGSVGQKSRAHTDAWVVGVEVVDDGGIVVDWSLRNDQRHITDYPVRSDAEITQAVRDAFHLDARLNTQEPQVAAHNGVVLLYGSVSDASARRAAEADANATLGVWHVRNEVLSQPLGKVSDADIERGVKRVLSDDPFFADGNAIKVSSIKGMVTLKGTVSPDFARFDAIEDVAAIPGVAEIDDALVVKLLPSEIKASIEDRLSWDPLVDRALVTVAVGTDGVATLTGTLDAWSEIKAAADDARRGGATRVVNTLKLKNHPEFVAQ